MVKDRVKRLAKKNKMPLTLTFKDPDDKKPDDEDDGVININDDASIAGVDEEESLQFQEPQDEDDLDRKAPQHQPNVAKLASNAVILMVVSTGEGC